jgi:hypothetical protein
MILALKRIPGRIAISFSISEEPTSRSKRLKKKASVDVQVSSTVCDPEGTTGIIICGTVTVALGRDIAPLDSPLGKSVAV